MWVFLERENTPSFATVNGYNTIITYLVHVCYLPASIKMNVSHHKEK